MKLSNKILIGFFGFIFIYMTAAFTEVRFRGTSNFIDLSNRFTETVDLTGVHYMVLEDMGLSIHIYRSDKPRIEVQSTAGDLLQKLQYNVSGDTLALMKMKIDKDQHVNISVYMAKNSLTGMTVNGASVNIEGLEQKELSISQHGGWITINDNNKLDKLTLEATNNANFTLFKTPLKTLSVLMKNSEVKINAPIGLLEGSMKDNSFLSVPNIEELQFKKDESSELWIR